MARKADATTVTLGRTDNRASIKKVATELLIKHGFHGMSFRDIAVRLDMTTTNIHYHFGNKERLVEEVLEDYVAETSAQHARIWLNDAWTLEQKLQEVLAYNHQRYKRFNRGKSSIKPWSLIGRLRLDGDVLSESARKSLAFFSSSVHQNIGEAVNMAASRQEISETMPQEDLSLLLVNLVNSSSVFTQDAGGFERLEAFFMAFSRVVLRAHAPRSPGKPSAG